MLTKRPPPATIRGLPRPRPPPTDGAVETSREDSYPEEHCARYHPAGTACQRRTPGGGPAGSGTWPPRAGSLRGRRWARWRRRPDAGPCPPGRTLGGRGGLTHAAERVRIQDPRAQRDEGLLHLVGTHPYLWVWVTLKLILRDKIITWLLMTRNRMLL